MRQVKEPCRSIKADMPFQIPPNAVIKAIFIHVDVWINAYKLKTGISEDLSPIEIVLYWQLS